MKIFLTSADNPHQKQVGGKHIHQLLFEKALNELGHEVDIFYPTYPKRKKIETAIKLIGNLLPLNAYGFLEYRLKVDSKNIFKTGLTSFTDKYDILHAQDPVSLLFTSDIKCHKRILTLHGYYTKECINYSKIADKYREKFSKWGMNFEKTAYALTDSFICVDSNIRDYLIDEFNIPKEKISVIFNAIDTVKFSPPTSNEINKLRIAYGFGDDKYLILVPRRLVKKNGVLIAVKAMKDIADENTLLLIAGDGPERATIEKESDEDKRIYFLGSVNHEQVIDYFKITDAVLIPSITSDGFQEATSLAMLEGMSMCKPTICSAIGGMKEVIKHNETGFLVKEQDQLAIANQINWIKQNQEKVRTITSNARNYILENHHYLSHAKKIVSFY
jgi:glycosyltransferase involved in cell wall biosynthesis